MGNEDSGTDEVLEWHRPATGRRAATRAIGLTWPGEVFALSHIAMPFPPDDPVYGNERPADSSRVFLGRIEAMGERGVLLLPATWQVRLRHNPFYDYLEERTLEWMGGPDETPVTDDPAP